MRPIFHFIRLAITFGIVCAVLYVAAIALVGAVVPARFIPNLKYPLGGYGHMHTRTRELIDHPPVDVLFIGSSHAYRGFDPRIWAKRGYQTFNLGSSAQTPIQSELLLREYLPTLRPQVLVIEVHPGPFRDEGLESAVDLIANRPLDAATVAMAFRTHSVMVINGLIHGATRQLLGTDRDFNERSVIGSDQYVLGGFVERKVGRFSPSGKLQRGFTEPRPDQWSAFLRMLSLSREHGCEVILVEAPTTKWLYASLYTDHDRFAERMAAEGRYIDMNGKVDLDDSLHFFTKGHLNQEGVERFNSALLDTLERRGWLPVQHHH